MRRVVGSNLLAAILVFCAATAIRTAWVVHFIASTPALSDQSPFEDAEMGHIATNLAQGRGFSSPFGIGSQPTAWECPFVPLVYAGIIRLEGGPTGSVTRAIFYLQCIVGGIAACVKWLVIRRLTDRAPVVFSRWLSPVIAVTVSVWPESVCSVTNPWYFVWQDAALAVFVLLAMRWWEQLSFGRGAVVGLWGGTLGIINVTPVPIVIGTILIPVVRSRPRLSGLRSAGISACCFVMVIAPWLARNAVVFRTPVPMRSNSGFELFQGNNAIECIRQPDKAPHPNIDRQEFQKYSDLGEIRYNEYSFHRAIEYIRSHPLQTIDRIADRIYVTWITDLTDHWAQEPWWTTRWPTVTRSAISALLIVAAFVTFLWGVIGGRLRLLPHWRVFALIFLFLPLPHYFTLADPEYTATFRLWIAIVAICMVGLQKSATSLARTGPSTAAAGDVSAD